MIVITEIYSSKYLAEAAFSNFLVQVNSIILYLFDERDCRLLMGDHAGAKIAYCLILIIQI